MGTAKKPSIDIGLSVLVALRAPGDTMSLKDIAEVCECNKNNIDYIEKRAIEKLRQTMDISDFI